MATNPVVPSLSRWLTDYNEAPWRAFVKSLEDDGLLLRVDGVMADARALCKTRFRCDTRRCAAVDRGRKIDSCCTDYDVELTPVEHEKIMRRSDDVIDFLARHDPERVSPRRKIGSFFEIHHSIHLVREKKRCGFSFRDASGRLWCGLHALALERNWPIEEIKPYACILFPLVVYRFENGDVLLTATSEETEHLFGGKDSERLPCVRQQEGKRMFEECQAAIEFGFGRRFYESLSAAAAGFLAGKNG